MKHIWISNLIVLASLSVCPMLSQGEVYSSGGDHCIFRYRPFEGTRPDYISSITSAGGVSHATGSSQVTYQNRGTGFTSFATTALNGTSHYIQASSAVSSMNTSGDDSFAIEAYFKADTISGSRVIFSNTESYTGFAMRIINGKVSGDVRFKNGSGYVAETVTEDSPSIEAGKWYYVVFNVTRDTNNYSLRIYVNGERTGYKTTSSRWNGVRQSSERPLIGAEPTSGVGTGSFFDGKINGVILSNYVYLDNYVKNQVVRDGSQYLGMPSYHDYFSNRANTSLRIHTTFNDYPTLATNEMGRFFAPYLNDSYIPQGLAYGGGKFYMSSYYKNADGVDDLYPSIVAEMDSTGNPNRVFTLFRPDATSFNAHVAAVGYWNNQIYIPSTSYIYRFDLANTPTPPYNVDYDTLVNTKGDQNPWQASARYNISNRGGNSHFSYCDIKADTDGTPILWTGQFDETDSNTSVLGYPISASGAVNGTPRYTFKLGYNKIQGITCYNITSTDVYIYASRSWGDADSQMYKIRYRKGTNNTGYDRSLIYTLPPGVEDVTMKGDQVWSVSESGARYYQKKTDGTPWDGLYPFVFGLKKK